jgi:AcrR family transcriptional regulator
VREADIAPPSDRDPLAQALIDLCFERGFENLSVEALCERAGVPKAEFDARHADLEDCFFAVYSAEFRRYRRAAEAARAGLTSWRERLRATAYALFRYLAEDERVTHLTVVEVRRAGDRSALLIGEGIEELIDLLDEGRNEPEAPANLTRATAESVAGGLFNRIYVSFGRGEQPVEVEVVPQAMYAAVLPYLGAQAAMAELEIAPPPDDVSRALCQRALIDLCFERGFSELTVEVLCERAGIDRATFEREYESLDGCFCAVFESELDQLLLDFASALAGARGWRTRLRAVAYAFHRWLASDPARTHLMVTEIRTASERARLIQARGIQQMIELLDEGRSVSSDPDKITKATAEALAGGILTQIYAAVGEGRLGPESEHVPQLMCAAVLPYLGRDAALEELEIPPPPNPSAGDGDRQRSDNRSPILDP